MALCTQDNFQFSREKTSGNTNWNSYKTVNGALKLQLTFGAFLLAKS